MPGRESQSTLLDKIGVCAIAALIVGPLIAWLRLVPALLGFGLFALSGIAATLVGIVAIVQLARGRGFGLGRLLAVLAGVAFVANAARGAGVPPINDFTTDLKDPPVFRHAATIPANRGRNLDYPADFVSIAQVCCADLQPARVALRPPEAFALAKRVATQVPDWTITFEDPASGTIEAVSTTQLFGFQDDIAIRVRDGGDVSIVDMRSKSRDGKGDLGTNADRIRKYVAAVAAAH
jgi:uncharacterized protein (DUF1499 family)